MMELNECETLINIYSMKRLSLLLLTVLLCTQAMQAQYKYEKTVEYGIFNHLGIGASVGTDGIGFDLAAPVASFAALRAGVSFWPKISYEGDIDIDTSKESYIADNVNLKGTVNVFNFKLLADLYPFKGSSLHLTGGVFIGNDDIINVSNTTMIIKDPTKYGKVGIKLGDRRITTDQNGYITADVTVDKVKPYVGIGFGRAVPTKSRLSVSCDLGVQFWGKPRAGAMTKNEWDDETYHKFSYTELDEYDDEDLKDGMKTAEKITIFPVLSIRLNGRIF